MKGGHEIFESGERSGWPLSSNSNQNVELVRIAVRTNNREAADDLNFYLVSIQSIPTGELGTRRVSRKF